MLRTINPIITPQDFAAAAILERALTGWSADQWCRETYQEHYPELDDVPVRYCASGRVIHAATEMPGGYVQSDEFAAQRALDRVVNARYGLRDMPEFNDHPDTTFEQIVAVFKQAIAELLQHPAS